jgi:hypothetical protein
LALVVQWCWRKTVVGEPVCRTIPMGSVGVLVSCGLPGFFHEGQ